MKCTTCGHLTEVRAISEKLQLGELRFVADLPAHVCPSCNESFIDDFVVEAFERLVALTILDEGLIGSATFRFLRQFAGLRANELAALLSVDKATVSRWENSRTPEATAFYSLCALVIERLSGEQVPSLRRTMEKVGAYQGERSRTLRVGEISASAA